MQQDPRRKNATEVEFFTEYGEANRYKIQEVIGKGSYGVVCSAIDTHTGEKVAIKKINDIFEHISDATRILREIKLLRLLRHPDIVEIKHIMLPPSRREFKDIYVVFELMESDLHQVIKANDDLTPEHYQFFLYQLLRALKYIHTGCAAKPGKVVGPVLPYDNGSVKEAYDPRRFIRNAVLTTSQYAAPIYSYPRSSTAKLERNEKEDGVSESNLVQPKAQYVGIGATRKVAVVQSGSSRLY